MYLARDLDFGDMNLDEDEFLNLERIPFPDLVEQVHVRGGQGRQDHCRRAEGQAAAGPVRLLKGETELEETWTGKRLY